MKHADDQQKYLLQWIISLGVSIVCCAMLFVVFSVYIMNLHDKTAVTAIRLEILQDRQNQILAQIDTLHHMLSPPTRNTQAQTNPAAAPVENTAAPVQAPATVPAPAPAPAPAQPTSIAPIEPVAAPPQAADRKDSSAEPAPVEPSPPLSIQLPETAPLAKP